MAVAMGSGSQVTKSVADVVLLEERVRPPARGGRRRPADRPQHPPARPALPDQVRLRRRPDPAGLGARLRLPVPAPAPDPRRLPDHRHPVLRARPCPLRRPALPRPAAAGAGCLRAPGRPGHGPRLDPFLLPDRRRLRWQPRRGPDRRDDDPDRARPLFRAAARTRTGPGTHRDPELHAGDDRRTRRPVRRDPRGDPSSASSSRCRC